MIDTIFFVSISCSSIKSDKLKQSRDVRINESASKMSLIEGFLSENRYHIKFNSTFLIVNQKVRKPIIHNMIINVPLVTPISFGLANIVDKYFCRIFFGFVILTVVSSLCSMKYRITYKRKNVENNERNPPISAFENHPKK